MTSKRARTPPISSSSRTPSPEPTPKAIRIASLPKDIPLSRPLFCTLPPTCNPPHRPTSLANSKELETHYATHHAHVCEERGCKCVFPEARLLELHQTECHDPIAAVRKDRGEKIFACHLATCPRLFATPKSRRLHLIEAHGYPKEYFFAVTNKGVGGLLRKWGEGASMLRGQWRPRHEADEDDDGDNRSDVEDDRKGGSEQADTLPGASSDSQIPLVIEDDYEPIPAPNDTVDTITNAMDSLNLVPSTIQFGRGAKRGGFSAHGRHGHIHMDIDSESGKLPARGGYRGRGRGRASAQNVSLLPSVPQNHHIPVQPSGHARGLGGGHRSGFPRRGRAIGRMVAARRDWNGKGL